MLYRAIALYNFQSGGSPPAMGGPPWGGYFVTTCRYVIYMMTDLCIFGAFCAGIDISNLLDIPTTYFHHIG